MWARTPGALQEEGRKERVGCYLKSNGRGMQGGDYEAKREGEGWFILVKFLCAREGKVRREVISAGGIVGLS